MANIRVLTKKSTVAAKVPVAGDLQVGELAVNTNDQILYTKHSDGTVRVVGVSPSDTRLTDNREWSASTVTQAVAEAGTDTTRTAWTAQRVRQSTNAWWASGNVWSIQTATNANKATLVDGDLFGVADSANSNSLKNFSFANLKTNLLPSFVMGSYSGSVATLGDIGTTIVKTEGLIRAAGSYTTTTDTKPNLHIDNLGNITRVEKEETNLYDISTHLVSGVYNLTLADRDRILYCVGGIPFEVVVPDALPAGFTFYVFTAVLDCFVTTTSPEYFIGAGGLEIQATLLVEPYCVNVYKNFGSSLGGVWYSYTQNASTNRQLNYANPTSDPLVDDDIFLVKIGGPTTIDNARSTTFGEMKSGMEGTFAKGPATSTNNAVAVFDGVTGKLLKSGGGVLAGGSVTGSAIVGGTMSGVTATSCVINDSTLSGAYKVGATDTRYVYPIPYDGVLVDYGMRLEFKTLNYLQSAVKDATGITPNTPAPVGTYMNTLTVTPWGDPSGGYPMQLGFDTSNSRLFIRSGLSYGGTVDRPTVASWTTGKTVALNATIHPTSANRGYFFFKCTTAGTTGATEPTWPITNAGTVTDGTAVWTAMPYWSKWRNLPSLSYTDTTAAVPNMVVDASGNMLRSTAVVGAGATAALARTAIGMDACGPITFTVQAPPVAPAATGVALFGKAVAGRNLPAYRGNTGLDSILQSSIVRNKLSRWLPIGNSVTVDTDGVGDLTATGVATLATVATTNRHTWQKRVDYLVTTAASTAVAGWSYTETMWGRGATTGDGGFFMVCRFGIATGTSVSTRRCFVGLRNSVAAPTDVNPSTLVNCIGVGYDAADAQLQIMHNDASGTCTKIALGASFLRPSTDRTSCYELALYCAPAGTTVGYEVTDLITGEVATGTMSTDLPAATTLLAPLGYSSVGGTSGVTGITLMSLGIETDY